MRKKKSRFKHSRRRAGERFGLRLNEDDMVALVKRIQNGEGHLSYRQSNSKKHYNIDVEKDNKRVWVCVVFNKHLEAIETFLEPDQEELNVIPEYHED